MKNAKAKRGSPVAHGEMPEAAPVERRPAQERFPVDSLAATRLGLEWGSVVREIRHTIVQFANHVQKQHGATAEEAVAQAIDPRPWESTDELLKRIEQTSIENLSWLDFAVLFCRDEQKAESVWKALKQEARREFLSGHRAAGLSESADWQREPWKRARFLAIREGLVSQWQPAGAIELTLIDVMAQAHSEYEYWAEEFHRRSTTDMKVSQELDERRYYEGAKGSWIPPRVNEQDAVEHAFQMMDRFNRLFLRTLRQLRDLRRYSAPITINNPKQVNIAADGGQQVNLAEVGKVI